MSCDVTNNILPTHLKKEVKDSELNEDGSMEVLDDCDASTVVNISLLKNKEKKLIIRDDESDAVDSLSSNKISLLNDHSENVVGYLEQHSICTIEGSDDEVSERFVIAKFLDESSPDALQKPILTKNIGRTSLFLLDVEPNDKEPLNLISGYCADGCKRFSTYSSIVWSHQDGCDIPLCHNCNETGIQNELRLMFKFKLHVMDRNGLHAFVHVWREQAEEFFGCSTKDFILEESSRDTAMNLLKQYFVVNTLDEEFTPLLDVSLVCINKSLFLVNTRLQLVTKQV